jgi:hypothetical protein
MAVATVALLVLAAGHARTASTRKNCGDRPKLTAVNVTLTYCVLVQ